MTPRHAEEPAEAADAALIFSAGNPTAEEIAAITAVATAALDELAEETVEEPVAPSAWSRSQRPIRRQLLPGPGAWRGFTS